MTLTEQIAKLEAIAAQVKQKPTAMWRISEEIDLMMQTIRTLHAQAAQLAGALEHLHGDIKSALMHGPYNASHLAETKYFIEADKSLTAWRKAQGEV